MLPLSVRNPGYAPKKKLRPEKESPLACLLGSQPASQPVRQQRSLPASQHQQGNQSASQPPGRPAS